MAFFKANSIFCIQVNNHIKFPVRGQKNKLLNEIEFLNIIGLRSKAEKIAKQYKQTLEAFNNREIKLKSYKLTYISLLIFASSMYYLSNLPSDKIATYNTKDNIVFAFAMISECTALIHPLLTYGHNKRIKNVKPPILKQTLSPQQITSLAESYNRQVYKEITLP